MKKQNLLILILLTANACHPSKITGQVVTHWGPFSFSFSKDISTNLAVGVATVLLATKIGYDMSWHTTYVNASQNWYQALNCTVNQSHIKTIDDPRLISLFSIAEHDEILQMHVWVNKAFNNWLTPWNWTTSLKECFVQLQVVEILTLYADLFLKKDTLTGMEIVKAFRCKYGNNQTYPLLFGYTNIDNHIQLIQTLYDHPLAPLLRSTIEPLNNIKILLRQENEYQQEVIAKRNNDLQQELISATYASGCRR